MGRWHAHCHVHYYRAKTMGEKCEKAVLQKLIKVCLALMILSHFPLLLGTLACCVRSISEHVTALTKRR